VKGSVRKHKANSVKFPVWYWIGRSITVSTTARHGTLSWARLIQSILSNSISLRRIIITYTSMSPKWIIPLRFPTKILYVFLNSSLPCYRPRSSHPPWSDTLIISGEENKLQSTSLRNFSRFSCYFLPIRPTHSVHRHPQSVFFP
jgi:hypothetical protein